MDFHPGRDGRPLSAFITRIARNVGALQSTVVGFLDEDLPVIGAEHFIQAHLIRLGRGPDSTVRYFMLYPGTEKEVELPDPSLGLYTTRRFTIDLSTPQPLRHITTGDGPVTRGRARRQAELHSGDPNMQYQGGAYGQFPPRWGQFTGEPTGWGEPPA